MAYTAGGQNKRALRLPGILAEGETASAATSQASLVALNQMLALVAPLTFVRVFYPRPSVYLAVWSN